MKCLSAAELGPRPKRADDWDTDRAASESTAGDFPKVPYSRFWRASMECHPTWQAKMRDDFGSAAGS